jgi:hypothetical protein
MLPAVKIMGTTVDFSKYEGTYSVEEMKGILNNMKTDILQKEKEIAIKKVKEIHGNKFTYEVKKGISVDLRKLENGQRVCACDVKGHHILMTEVVSD